MQQALTFAVGKKHTFLLTVFSVGLCLPCLSSLGIGAVSISPAELWQVILYKTGITQEVNAVHELVLFNIRLPRLLLTLLVGAVLGISGAALQGLFRNPLVEPGLIGISSGAAMGAIFVIIVLGALVPQWIEPMAAWLLPVFAFIGGVVATWLTLKLAQSEGKTHITYLILAGVAINAMAGAAIGLAIFYADDTQIRTYTFWTLGDLSGATWDKLALLIPLVLFTCYGLVRLARPLNALALGESEAFHSGIAVERVKMLTIVLSALAVGVSVSFVGIIGFIGLIVPHIIRIAVSSDHSFVLPASALGGAALLLIADLFARTAAAPAELPIGVVTAFIGTPFFLYLLISSKKKRLI